MANSLFCTCHSHRENEKRDSRYRGLLLDSMDLHSGAMAPWPAWALMLPWDSVTAASSWPSKLSAGWETQRRWGAAGPAAGVAPVNWVSVVTGMWSFAWRRLGGLPRLPVVMGEELGISRRQLDDEQRKSWDYKSQVLRQICLFPTTIHPQKPKYQLLWHPAWLQNLSSFSSPCWTTNKTHPWGTNNHKLNLKFPESRFQRSKSHW